jgi:hypothetical protein
MQILTLALFAVSALGVAAAPVANAGLQVANAIEARSAAPVMRRKNGADDPFAPHQNHHSGFDEVVKRKNGADDPFAPHQNHHSGFDEVVKRKNGADDPFAPHQNHHSGFDD